MHFLLAVKRDPVKPAVMTIITTAAHNWPRPCIAKTDPIMAPLHFVVANSDVIMEERG